MIPKRKIIDVCCGGRMFWFNKAHPNALYVDNRTLAKEKLSNRQTFEVSPDLVADFRRLPIKDDFYYLVIFDPPHMASPGRNSWMRKKYGALDPKTWREDLMKGFSECFRILKRNGVLIFKWNEERIPLKEVLALTPYEPIVGHPSGRQSKTHWVTFMKL